MELAKKEFAIPMVLEPEYLASPFLDELSGMTYLSYFMRENSPGFFATLNWVTQQIPQMRLLNFTVFCLQKKKNTKAEQVYPGGSKSNRR